MWLGPRQAPIFTGGVLEGSSSSFGSKYSGASRRRQAFNVRANGAARMVMRQLCILSRHARLEMRGNRESYRVICFANSNCSRGALCYRFAVQVNNRAQSHHIITINNFSCSNPSMPRSH
jgi:hypothetical protein